MPEPTKRKPFLSRPKDRSLASFKLWLREISKSMLGDVPDNSTEEDYIEWWKKFWKSDNPLEEKEQQPPATDEKKGKAND